MNINRFTLEPYKGANTRHHCPACNSKDKTFSLYIDTLTGQHVHDSVGRCNRESNCGYHYTPSQYFRDNNISFDTTPSDRMQQAPPKPEPSFIDAELFKQSLAGYKANNFVTFLKTLFDDEITSQLIAKYFIGSSKHWQGSTIFWQIDTKGKIRTGKIMLYDAITGKRIKKPIDCITWVQSVLKLPKFELKQSLFGEHLLNDKTKPTAIVESEKTAIIASIYLPQFTWLAVGGKDGLNLEKLQCLNGRTVVLFPDLKYFEKWSGKAKDFSDRMIGTRFFVSDLLERNATEQERDEGLDIADYLIKFDYRQFRNEPTIEEIKVDPAQLSHAAHDEVINWFSGHLLRSMELSDSSFIDSLRFDSG